MHEYTCHYQSNKVEYYFDGVLRHTLTQFNPPLLTGPMDLRLTLGLFGGGAVWSPLPDATTVWPIIFRVDRVEVWQPGTVPVPPTSTDTTLPTVSLVVLSEVKRKSKVTVQATAADNIRVTRVDFQVNGSPIYSVANAPYLYEFNTTGKPGGTYRIDATAYDAAGNHTTTTLTVKAQ